MTEIEVRELQPNDKISPMLGASVIRCGEYLINTETLTSCCYWVGQRKAELLPSVAEAVRAMLEIDRAFGWDKQATDPKANGGGP